VSIPSTVESSPRAHISAPSEVRGGRRRPSGFRVLAWTLGLATALLILYPLVMALGDVLGFTHGEIRLGQLVAVWRSSETWALLRDTVILVGSSGALALLAGACLAWLNERTDARMGWIAKVLPVMSMFIPGIAAAIGWVFLASPDAGFLNQLLRDALGLLGLDLQTGPINIFSWYGLIFVSALVMTPYSYLAIAGGLRSLDAGLE